VKRIWGLLLSVLGGCSAATPPLRVLSLNIANGFVDATGTAPFRDAGARERQRLFIEAQTPDVVGLQEVDVGCARSGGIDTAAAVLPSGGTLIFTETGNDGVGGRWGNALWLRQGLVVSESWQVPLSYPDVGGRADWPRAAQFAAIVAEDGRKLMLATTHLTTMDPNRARQLLEAVALVPDVFFGDMNALGPEIAPYVPELRLVTSPGSIDQVWIRGKGEGWLVPTLGASDHPYAACGVVQ
jgi:endonuclease/exonuclease/phosphatase family metal-dependent hydrolase